MGKYIGIDLGTANTLCYVKGEGIIIREPSFVAYDIDTDKVLAVGNEAKIMAGKTPSSINAVRPLKDGVIADFELTTEMLKAFFVKASKNSMFSQHPSVVICIPHNVTDVERKAVEQTCLEAGAKSVAIIEEPIAAAIGAGLQVKSPYGNMIVDIGGGTTEVAVISMYGIANSVSLRVAGDKFNDAISSYIRKKFNVLIGDSAAEEIKITIGSAHRLTDIGVAEVRGRNIVSGLPAAFNVYSSDIREALEEPLNQIVDAIRETLEKTPPELCSDIYDSGITLCGGGALLCGINTLIEEKTRLPVSIAKRPLDCVADGIGKIIEQKKLHYILSHVKHE